MSQDTNGKPPARGGGQDVRRDDRPGDRKGGGGGGRGPGGFKKGGKGGFRKDGPKRAPAETYETLKELTRGPGYRIDKFVLAEKGTHKAVRTEYRLTREGLNGPRVFARLFEAQAAATEPLPEPQAESEPEAQSAEVQVSDEAAETHEAVEGDVPAETIGTVADPAS